MAVRRLKYQPLIDYYYRAAAILRDRLPYIPAVQLSEGKTYYGSAWRHDGKVRAITLSTVRCWPIDHKELIDTIAHELAHIIHYDHGPQHDTVTRWFKKILMDNWREQKDAMQGA